MLCRDNHHAGNCSTARSSWRRNSRRPLVFGEPPPQTRRVRRGGACLRAGRCGRPQRRARGRSWPSGGRSWRRLRLQRPLRLFINPRDTPGVGPGLLSGGCEPPRQSGSRRQSRSIDRLGGFTPPARKTRNRPCRSNARAQLHPQAPPARVEHAGSHRQAHRRHDPLGRGVRVGSRGRLRGEVRLEVRRGRRRRVAANPRQNPDLPTSWWWPRRCGSASAPVWPRWSPSASTPPPTTPTTFGQHPMYNKVGGALATGEADGAQAAISSILYGLTIAGFDRAAQRRLLLGRRRRRHGQAVHPTRRRRLLLCE